MHDDEVDIILVPSTPSQGPSNVRPPTPKKEVFNGLFGGRRRGIASAKSEIFSRKKIQTSQSSNCSIIRIHLLHVFSRNSSSNCLIVLADCM